MLTGEYSINAKLLYGLLLNRTILSQKNGWESENGNVYVIYTIKQMANDLDRSERTVKTALRELENAGLITRVRQGWNQANRIFLQIPDGVQFSSRPEGNICPMDGQDSSPSIGQELPTSNTEQEYKDKGYMPLPVDIECVQDIAIPLRDGTMVYGDLYPVAKRHTADLSRLQKFCVFIHKAVTFRFLISPDLSLQHKCSICRWARRFHHTDFRRSYTPCQ